MPSVQQSLTHKMIKEDKTTWKANYFMKIIQLFDEFLKCFIVNGDNVRSRQMVLINAFRDQLIAAAIALTIICGMCLL